MAPEELTRSTASVDAFAVAPAAGVNPAMYLEARTERVGRGGGCRCGGAAGRPPEAERDAVEQVAVADEATDRREAADVRRVAAAQVGFGFELVLVGFGF